MNEPAQSVEPQSVGRRLKAERERRGMSTQKVADEMRLDAWVIDALEAEDYPRIGPAVYAKGHLRKYASILGMSAADIMAGSAPQAAPTITATQAANIRMPARSAAANPVPWPQVAGFAAIALIIGALVWWRPWHPRSIPAAAAATGAAATGAAATGEAPASAAAPGDSTPGDSALASGVAEQPGAGNLPSEATLAADAGAPPAGESAATAAPAVLAKTAPAPESTALAGAGRARLRLSFSADSWVDVRDADGRRLYAGNGRANSVKMIAGSAPLRVYLGYASGVQLELNDRAVAIGPQFVSGDVAHFEAGADGVLRRDNHATPANGAQPHGVAPHG
jgi:cytoskeleton protein RodZ